ncbi:MAG: PqqD family protein [Bacteroidales bacterium]|nr:PqqD family protein [Bacteroidales bacterium]
MKLKYEFSIQEVADMFVAVAKNLETQTVEKVFNLNETGAIILQALQDGKDVSDIVALLLSKYDVNQQQATDEVNAFITMLIENGWAE